MPGAAVAEKPDSAEPTSAHALSPTVPTERLLNGAGGVPALRREPAPASRLLWLCLAVGVLACLVPWAVVTLRLAALIIAAAVVLASLDLLFGNPPPPRIEVLGPDGMRLTALRLIEGRSQVMRLGITCHERWRSARLTLLAADVEFARGVETPTGIWQLHLASGERHLWSGKVKGRARGLFHGLRCGWEQRSWLGLWCVRQWQTLPCEFRIYPDLSSGRHILLHSPVYRSLAASALVPLTGQGREFERLREYQSGDLYADLSWKATARRAYPITRLFQWERQQEVYFVVDHARLSALPGGDGRPHLERYIETALTGATAAAGIGDHFGLIGFSEGVTHWVGAGSGRLHFNACRDRLLAFRPSATTPAFDRLFAAIRSRLRRRCYLVFLTDLTERGLAESFQQSASLVSQTHVVLVASILPPAARPLWRAYSQGAITLEAIYGELAGDLELRRIAGLARQLSRSGIHFRAVPESQLLSAAIEAYLENKRGQRL